MSSIDSSKQNEKRKHFIVLNSDGSGFRKIPFQTAAEKFEYERWVEVESEKMMIIHQQKIEE